MEWETAADTEKRLDVSLKTMVNSMWSVILLALLVILTIAITSPTKLERFIPLAVAWVSSLWIAYRVSLPNRHKKEILSFSEQLAIRRWARKIWAFFEEYVCLEDNWLPPDNVQIDPANGVAHRTSPTNIGLALLANLTARDFGYITLAEVHARIEHTLHTIEGLGQWKGHLYNWYDTQSLVPLEPRYVSTVDSGNFVLYLLTLKSGLAQTISDKSPIDVQFAHGLKDTYHLLIEAVGKDTHEELNKFGLALDQILGSVEAWNIRNWMDVLSSWPSSFVEQDELTPEGVYWANRLNTMIQSFRQETRDFFHGLSCSCGIRNASSL